MRFIETLGEMAIECMSIKLSGSVVSQNLGYRDEMEMVFFFVNIKTDDTAVELMFPESVFSPDNHDDDEVVALVCTAFQTDDEDRVRDLLRKADLIDGQTSTTQEGA